MPKVKEEESTEIKIKAPDVAFTKEQMEIIQSMLTQVRENSSSSTPAGISVYNQRDPRSIETVNVRRFHGMFVLGFKNHNTDPFKKKPQYCVYKADVTRGLHKEPYITLILSNDGKEVVEKEVMLVDYMSEREYMKLPVLEVVVKKIIEDHGVLGSTGEYAIAVNDKGLPESRPTILAQTEREERTFIVPLPGFEKPVEFISDFLA